MIKNILLSLSLVAMLFTLLTKPISAINTPSFPSCLNPQGTVIASYANGNHGIVGYSSALSGTDKVYKLTNETVLQCFCSEDGNGIQTNWLKISDLAEDEIKSLEVQGWIYVPNGAAWGLDNAPYLAKNSNYSCKSSTSGTSSSTGGGSSSSSSSSSSSTGGGSDLTSKVLGLAFTGSSEYIYKLWLYGLVALIFGVWIKRYNARKKSSQ